MNRFIRKTIVTIILLATGPDAGAQAEDAASVHWAYSTWFGSGWYQIADAQDAFVMRYTHRRSLSDARISKTGEREWGMDLRFPVTVGLNHFSLDDLPDSVDPENLANISVTPSLYLTWPASDRWTLRPFAALGWGTLLNGDGSAWTYWAGVKSRFMLLEGERQLALLNSLGVVGYSPSEGPSDEFWPIVSGLELTHPAVRDAASGTTWQLNWHLSYTFFQDDLDIVGRSLETEPISDQWELGIAVSREKTPIRIWRFDFDRLGLSYRVSSDGDLQGIGFVFGSIFDQ